MNSKNYIISLAAQSDVEEILLNIAKHNLSAAKKFHQKFEDTFELLSFSPEIGHIREDLTKKKVKFLSVGNFMIIYEPKHKPLRIVRVLSAYRDIKNML